MWMGGGGQTQKALPEPLRPNCEPAGLPPPPMEMLLIYVFLLRYGIFSFFGFPIIVYSYLMNNFCPTVSWWIVDTLFPPPPRDMLTPPMHRGKKFSDSWEKSINNSFWPRELKTIDIFYIFIIIKIKYFLVFSFSNSVHKKYSYFWEKSTGNTVAYGPMTSKPLTFLNLNFDNQDIVFFGFHFLNSVCTVSR